MTARSRSELDRAWTIMVALVMENLDDYRRQASDATGLPFSRVRALKRLDQPRTMSELAEALASDAPATTVAVNELEERGLVERRPHPEDRRAKIVSLTPAGKRALAALRAVPHHAPESLAALPAGEVADLLRILGPFGGR